MSEIETLSRLGRLDVRSTVGAPSRSREFGGYVRAIDQQTSKIDVTGFCDAELGISFTRLTTPWPQANVTTDISIVCRARASLSKCRSFATFAL